MTIHALHCVGGRSIDHIIQCHFYLRGTEGQENRRPQGQKSRSPYGQKTAGPEVQRARITGLMAGNTYVQKAGWTLLDIGQSPRRLDVQNARLLKAIRPEVQKFIRSDGQLAKSPNSQKDGWKTRCPEGRAGCPED